jgi:hypothetical protein
LTRADAALIQALERDLEPSPSAHKTIGTVLQNRADAYAQDCKMK